MARVHFVTGANGHLGNAIVRALLARGASVRAGVRDLDQHAPFEGLSCQRVHAELRDLDEMSHALKGVDVLYQVAAVFKHWSAHPERDIVHANVDSTCQVLMAAARAGVRRVVYVSSVAAVGHDGTPRNELDWSDETDNPYYRSKTEAELMASSLAPSLGLDMVVIAPGAMVGPHCHRLTDTMRYLDQVRRGQVPLDPDFHFNFVDVRDVADGAIAAAERGRRGERYILANDHPSSLADMLAVLRELGIHHRLPPRAPRWLLHAAAWADQSLSMVTGRAPNLTPSQVRLFHGVRQVYDIRKARFELGYAPRSPEAALRAGFEALMSASPELIPAY